VTRGGAGVVIWAFALVIVGAACDPVETSPPPSESDARSAVQAPAPATTTTTKPPTTTTTKPPVTTTTVPPTTTTTKPPVTTTTTTKPPVTTTTTVPVATPSAPRSLSATRPWFGRGVWLTWTAPATGPVTGYNVYRRTGSGALVKVADLGVTTSWTDPNTVSGTSYTYAVSAENGTREGPLSNLSTAVAR